MTLPSDEIFSPQEYKKEMDELFVRFPSVQNSAFTDAYKPGLERMRQMCALLGNPQNSFRSVHVAGTNGKGSVANMLASALSACGMSAGLYTSPHLADFRERMRIARENSCTMIPEEYVFGFIRRWKGDFERLSLSFFEITTAMAFRWFADEGVEWAVVETGLGGRLDSTNVITPQLSVITSIGLDHCDLLGTTLDAIAAEKAGIIKPGVPVVIGETRPETAPVFRESAARCGSLLLFADAAKPALLWDHKDVILSRMDLCGPCIESNLRTVLTALGAVLPEADGAVVEGAICKTASRMGFRGRWERLLSSPEVICDIGHNAAALKWNFERLAAAAGEGRPLYIVYGIMADKDLDAILPLMPVAARWYFAAPSSRRSLGAVQLLTLVRAFRKESGLPADGLMALSSVREAVALALFDARKKSGNNPLIYIGGSTFVVSEAITMDLK